MQRASNAATDTYTNTNTAALELMGNKKICVYEATSVADKRHLCGTAAAKKTLRNTRRTRRLDATRCKSWAYGDDAACVASGGDELGSAQFFHPPARPRNR